MSGNFRISSLILTLTGVVLSASAAFAGEELLGGPQPKPYQTHSVSNPFDDRTATNGNYGNGRHYRWLCRQLREQGSLWGPDYLAGLDAAGGPVAPADISGVQTPSHGYEVSLDVPVAAGRTGRQRQTPSAEVFVDTSSGIVVIGGRPVGPAQLANLRRTCGRPPEIDDD